MPHRLMLLAPSHIDDARPISTEEREVFTDAMRDRKRQLGGHRGGIGIVMVNGAISPDGGYWGTSTMELEQEFQAAMDDPSIGTVVLVVDSPGGTYAGTPEAAAMVFNARGRKRIVTYIGGYGMMASGALWIGTAADYVVATPSASGIGSIGAFIMHAEQSRMLDEMGITTTIVRSPEGKGRPNSVEPLDVDSAAEMQADVERINAEFVMAVARHRKGKITSQAIRATNARVFPAREAASIGLIDSVQAWPQFAADLTKTTGRARITASGLHPRLKLEALRRDGHLPPSMAPKQDIAARAVDYAAQN